MAMTAATTAQDPLATTAAASRISAAQRQPRQTNPDPSRLFDEARWAFASPRHALAGFEALVSDLQVFARHCPDRWADVVRSVRGHAVFRDHLESPFTNRAYRKPRGYAADPLMTDFLLDEPEAASLLAATHEQGRILGEAWLASRLGVAVRRRRAALGAQVRHVARRSPGASLLSVGAGHLWEVRAPDVAPAARNLGEVVAVDQDRRAVEDLRGGWSPTPLRAEERAWADLAGSGIGDLGRFNLIVAPALLDLFDDRSAVRLLGRLGEGLAPGGRLVVAGIRPSLPTLAAMDALLDWRPRVREPGEVDVLLRTTPGLEGHHVLVRASANDDLVVGVVERG